jgi:TPR repeat protein
VVNSERRRLDAGGNCKDASNKSAFTTVKAGGKTMSSCLELAEDRLTEDDAISVELERLQYAAYEGYTPAMYDYGLCCSDPKQRIRWLRLAAEEGHLQAMYLLGGECDDFAERRRWLQTAAEEGHVAAMFDFARLCGSRQEKRRWLTEAARNGLQAAALELAEMDD